MCFLNPSLFCFLPLGAYCILPVCFGLAIRRPLLINIYYAFAYKKKKKEFLEVPVPPLQEKFVIYGEKKSK